MVTDWMPLDSTHFSASQVCSKSGPYFLDQESRQSLLILDYKTNGMLLGNLSIVISLAILDRGECSSLGKPKISSYSLLIF